MERHSRLKYIILIILLLSMQNICDAKYNDDWHSGALVLQDHQVLVGQIAFNQGLGVVMVKEKEVIKTFSARSIVSFRFYDKGINVNRKFIVTKNAQNNQFLEIYEVVLAGRISVLRKVKKYLMSTTGEYLHPKNSNIDLEVQQKNFKYFVMHNSEIVSISKFKKRIFPVIEEKWRNEIVTFMEDYKINLNNSANSISLITYVNQLHNEEVASLGL